MRYALAFATLLACSVLPRPAVGQEAARPDTLIAPARLPIYSEASPSGQTLGYIEQEEVIVLSQVVRNGSYDYGEVGTGRWAYLGEFNLERGRREWEVLRNAETRGIPIMVKHVKFGVNHAGGVTPWLRIKNLGSKRIKYVHVDLVPFNAVGDVVRNDLGSRAAAFTLDLVGPIEPGQTGEYMFGDNPPFYNGTTSCLEVRRIRVDFFGGGTTTLIKDLAHARHSAEDVRLNGECQ